MSVPREPSDPFAVARLPWARRPAGPGSGPAGQPTTFVCGRGPRSDKNVSAMASPARRTAFRNLLRCSLLSGVAGGAWRGYGPCCSVRQPGPQDAPAGTRRR